MRRRSFLLAALALPALRLPAHAAQGPEIRVLKSPSCGCCTAWADHLSAAGFSVDLRDVPDEQLWTMKDRLGIGEETASCHTAMIEGYVIEGHVPAEDITRLINERPDALGLAVPGMPIGSPGMEMGDSTEPFTTLLLLADGETRAFARHG
ncbi:Protein of unknown function, DUF [Phaeobacter italicus]|jgi:hypothetical protein|uniref:Metal-binding protein n=1 Tax=Phaeobacter italicus TaxID=481446 RepID=A0A0H5DH33_9RHOB|nr:DUF411 domain-containing protein [Phaeobacter italicus]CRL10760.1 Protein of unknown function, DUF [Phaeobacter italicus]